MKFNVQLVIFGNSYLRVDERGHRVMGQFDDEQEKYEPRTLISVPGFFPSCTFVPSVVKFPCHNPGLSVDVPAKTRPERAEHG